jgi:Tfp pilus assembly protein PilO
MLLRNTTRARLGGVALALVAVVVVNVWFWTSYTSGARTEIARLTAQLTKLKADAEGLKQRKEDADRRANEFNKQILEREKELEQYGDFLPSIRTKPLVIKEILSLVEELGVKIWKIEYSPLVSEEGCYTFYKSERIFRLKKFDVATYDNAKHNMEVYVEFQTYFGDS